MGTSPEHDDPKIMIEQIEEAVEREGLKLEYWQEKNMFNFKFKVKTQKELDSVEWRVLEHIWHTYCNKLKSNPIKV